MRKIYLFAFLLGACATHTEDPFMQVEEAVKKEEESIENAPPTTLQPGMTESEVTGLVGPPDFVKFNKKKKELYFESLNPPKVLTLENGLVLTVKDYEKKTASVAAPAKQKAKAPKK